MSHPVKDKYLEPMVKGEKSTRKRDSGYGGTGSDRSSHRRTGSRKSNESSSGGSGGYAEPEIGIASQRWDMSQLHTTLQAKDDSIDRYARLNYDLEKDLIESNNQQKRLRRERDDARKQNDELRASLASAYKEIERLQKEAKRQRESGKDSKKSSNKSGSKENWKDMPVPLYRAQTPPPVPEMPRNARPTSSNSRPTGQRRMSMSQAPAYTYTVTPMTYG